MPTRTGPVSALRSFLMFAWFERRLDPYPEDAPGLPPKGLFAFCWHYTKPAWPWLLVLGICSMLIAVAEVMLSQFLGNIVDCLSDAARAPFLQQEGGRLAWTAVILPLLLPLAGQVPTI